MKQHHPRRRPLRPNRARHLGRVVLLGLCSLLILGLVRPPAPARAQIAIGDTLTVIQRPLLNVPAIVTPGESLAISCSAGPSATGWAAELWHDQIQVPLTILSSVYDPTSLWWTVTAQVPSVDLYELYEENE